MAENITKERKEEINTAFFSEQWKEGFFSIDCQKAKDGRREEQNLSFKLGSCKIFMENVL